MSFWSGLVSIVAKVSPILGALLGGPAGGSIGSMIAKALGVDDNPDAVMKAIQNDPNAIIKLKQMELDNQAEIQRIINEADTSQQHEVNETMRAEIASTDRFKSSWRPMFGYIVAFTWGIQSVGIFIAVIYCVFHSTTMNLLNLIASIEQSMSTSWMIALAVLGVNITQRTKEKLANGGVTSPSIIDTVKGVFKK